MEQLDKYKAALQSIYDYFGYKEGWEVYPINDNRKYWWIIDRNQVFFFDTKEVFLTLNDDLSYDNEIINNQIYVGKDYTMILADTHTDGNKFLQIFDNAKKLQ